MTRCALREPFSTTTMGSFLEHSSSTEMPQVFCNQRAASLSLMVHETEPDLLLFQKPLIDEKQPRDQVATHVFFGEGHCGEWNNTLQQDIFRCKSKDTY
jgi:hypothetical protein